MNSDQQQHTIERIRKSLSGEPTKILLIEDDENDAKLAMRVMKDYGIEVVWARDQVEAMAASLKEFFRLIFLDLKLDGGSSGLDLIARLKEGNPKCWVVVLSGAYAEDSRECKDALKLGAGAVMLKPLTPSKVELIFGSP